MPRRPHRPHLRRGTVTPLLVLLLAIIGGGIIDLRTRGGAAPATTRTRTGTTHRALRLITEPGAGVAPFLALIAGARHSIELTMYELEDPRVLDGLAAAARRGVAVRVLLNGGYYDEPESTNLPAARFLRAHAVQVRFSPRSFALTHQKTLTVDSQVTAIMTLNFDGDYASTRDYAVLDPQPADIRAVLATFDADWSDRPIRPSRGTGDLVWSPGASDAVLGLIHSARRSIKLENEEMADRPATAALCAAARRGVNVLIVMTDASRWHAAFDDLARCGAHVHVDEGQAFYIHAKVLDVDSRVALIGSQNLSPTSLEDNRELGIEVRTPGLVAQVGRDVAADAAAARAW